MDMEKLHNNNEQNQQREKPILEDLDLGIGGSNIEAIAARVNIPYLYLPEKQRRELNTIVEQYLVPNLRDKLRMGKDAGLFTEKIKSLRNELDPSVISISDFWRQMKSVDSERITLHSQIAQFLNRVVRGDVPDEEKILAQGRSLYQNMLQVEPSHMAFSSKIKDFLNFYEDNTLPGYSLTPEEQLLALTPSAMHYYVRLYLDLIKYRLSIDTPEEIIEKKRLTKLHFNDDPCQFAAYSATREELEKAVSDEDEREKLQEYITSTEEHFRNLRNDKLYLLIERKIPDLREVDNLLIMDNCLQGYFDSKKCFIHDIFLKMYLVAKKKGLDFQDMITNIKDCAKETIFFPDEALLNYSNS